MAEHAVPLRAWFSPALPLVALTKVGARVGLGAQILMDSLTRRVEPRRPIAALRSYETGAHDVFVAVFYKSGTNWALQIVQQLAWHGAAEFDHIHDVVPWPEMPMRRIAPIADPGPWQRSPTRMRAVKTHLLPSCLPWSDDAKYLCVIRDPKEILVSSYHFFTGVFDVRDRVSARAWHHAFVSPGGLADAWAEHTAGYWALRDRANVLVTTYAELQADLRGVVEQVAGLMGTNSDAGVVDEVVRRSAYPWMKAHQRRFAPPLLPLVRERPPPMIRRGVAGDSGELLDQDQQRAVDRVCRARLRALGSDFPYPDLFAPTRP